ncbi:MAG: hypothetical protein GY810_12950 [Aureispira sp.]|nr:hypothetical protein [Aureispira sp.]
MKYRYTALLGLLLLATSLFSQDKLMLDSIQLIKQSTYEYKNDNKVLESYKESRFDTNQVMIEQNRYHYLATDTGLAVVTHYKLVYNPKTYLGSYYTERLPHAKRPKRKYSKKLTKYKSFDHETKKKWVKQYSKENKLIKETRNSYNAQGLTIKSKITDHHSSPPTIHTDEVERNSAGKMTFWESHDDDGTGLKKVRQHEWTYLNDTLLLESSGYVYNNWTQIKNKYKKGVLLKSTNEAGFRQSTGKVKLTHKVLKKYKDGRLVQELIFDMKKKEFTKTYVYEGDLTTETIETKEGIKVNTVKEVYDGDLLIEESTTEEGKPRLVERYTYDELTKTLLENIEIEYRKSGKEWKTITKYDSAGNLVSKTFYVNDKPVRVDAYEYVYYK